MIDFEQRMKKREEELQKALHAFEDETSMKLIAIDSTILVKDNEMYVVPRIKQVNLLHDLALFCAGVLVALLILN